MPRRDATPRPLDHEALQRLALRYVERYATTRARLVTYLERKLFERGHVGERPDPQALAARMADLGYVDDRAFAEARARSMGRRGLGARRIAEALRAAGVEEDDRGAVASEVAAEAEESAMVFARRRRIGPFATARGEPAQRERQLAAMVRAGHDFATARRIVEMDPADEVE